MLDDKFAEYISGYKSPFEEDELDDDAIVYDGIMRYYRDCMVKSIGTSQSPNEFTAYWEEFYPNITDEQKRGFLNQCVNKIIKHYKMNYLSSILEEKNYSNDELADFVKFVALHKFLKFFPRCFNYIHPNIINNDAMLHVFITSDYGNFTQNLANCKSCNSLIREYFNFCSRNDGIETALMFLKDDIIQNLIEQNSIYKKV